MLMVERSRDFVRQPPCPFGAQPVAGGNELRQRVGQFRDQRRAGGGRQAFQHQHRFPDGGEMAMPFDDAVPGKRRKLGIGVFDQFERCRRRTDFGNRGGNRRRQIDAAGDRALHVAGAGRDDVDEVGVDQKRRMFEHRQRDRRLVGRQRPHDRGRRVGAAREYFRHRLANQRRRIVEQHQQRAFGGDAIVLGEI